MTDWKTEVCGDTMPQELDLVSPDTYIQRKDIHLVPADFERGTEEHYECLRRFITVAEYNNLKAIEDFRTDEAIDAYTLSLIEGGIL